MNILVYAGRGTSAESLYQVLRSLKIHTGSLYDVKSVTADALLRDPWEESCSLLVIPGGRDLPYVEDLTGRACDRIRKWVECGGRYLGICAGAYFSCSRVEFELGRDIEVEGPRELALCPATARGAIVPNFEYEGERGAKMVLLGSAEIKSLEYRVYCNGGCWFDFGTATPPPSWKTLYFYKEFSLKPAIIMSEVGLGRVILSGTHPEYDLLEYLQRHPKADPSLICEKVWEKRRRELWDYLLSLLGLNMGRIGKANPTLDLSLPPLEPSPLLLFCRNQVRVGNFKNLFLAERGSFTCEATKFHLLNIKDLPIEISESNYPILCASDDEELFAQQMSFDAKNYFKLLASSQKKAGTFLLYAERIFSTQTLLTSNPKFAECLSDGSIILAGDQLAGKGRAGNSWLSSKGCLQFTMVLRHENAKSITLIQYLVGLAMLESLISEPDYSWLAKYIHLKWPNDLYSSEGHLDSSGRPVGLKKLGGILVNSQNQGRGFLLLIGFGFNITDTPWTRSLNEVIEMHNQRNGTSFNTFSKERVLARYCITFERLYNQMTATGFPFDLYHQRWLHSSQVVFLEKEQIRARIEGIDAQGYLIARPHVDGLLGLLGGSMHTHEPDSPSSAPFLLQPDGNSFDMMQNLIKRKI